VKLGGCYVKLDMFTAVVLYKENTASLAGFITGSIQGNKKAWTEEFHKKSTGDSHVSCRDVQ